MSQKKPYFAITLHDDATIVVTATYEGDQQLHFDTPEVVDIARDDFKVYEQSVHLEQEGYTVEYVRNKENPNQVDVILALPEDSPITHAAWLSTVVYYMKNSNT